MYSSSEQVARTDRAPERQDPPAARPFARFERAVGHPAVASTKDFSAEKGSKETALKNRGELGRFRPLS